MVRCCIDEEMREKEKSMLRELNNKLAVYIAKVMQFPVPPILTYFKFHFIDVLSWEPALRL